MLDNTMHMQCKPLDRTIQNVLKHSIIYCFYVCKLVYSHVDLLLQVSIEAEKRKN